LLVSQNGWRTHLYRNAGAKPGLRVRIAGPEGNATAIGAQVRLVFGAEKGPAKEVQSGTGYWSQNSHTLIFGLGEKQPTGVSVRWPGGKETNAPVAGGSREVTVEQ
jgi:enediyne biosynthesis protein E4